MVGRKGWRGFNPAVPGLPRVYYFAGFTFGVFALLS